MQTLPLIIQKLCTRLVGALHASRAGGPRRAKTVLVTSAHPGEGKTFVAAAIGTQLAKLGYGPVLLADANFEKPGLHRQLGVPEGDGLSHCLADESAELRRIVRAGVPGLDILTAGKGCDASLLFNQERIRRFLDATVSAYEWLIFDGASLAGAGDNGLLSLVDGLILVIDSRRTRWQVVKDAINSLAIEEGRLLGAVLNRRKYEIPSFLYRWS